MTEEYISRKAAKDAIFDYICGHTMSKFPSKELLMASKKGAEGAFNEIDYVPTADVVPRAEVDKTIAEWAYLHADAVNKLDNVRAEVAREVIEEIFLRIREEFSISELGKSALNQLEAELKKKYAGEE